MNAPITPQKFRKMPLPRRYMMVKRNGTHLASRFFEGFHVHLYAVHDFKVELWYRVSLNQLVYLEVCTNEAALKDYVDAVDLKDLGL